MGGLCCCIVACTQLGNGTVYRTVAMAAPVLLTNGLSRNEAVLYNNFLVFCVCKGMYAGDGLD